MSFGDVMAALFRPKPQKKAVGLAGMGTGVEQKWPVATSMLDPLASAVHQDSAEVSKERASVTQ